MEVQIFGAEDCVVKQIASSQDNASFEKGADSIDFVIYFRPPIKREEGHAAHVSFAYVGNEETPHRHIFGQPIVPSGVEPVSVVLRAEELEYQVYQTHQIKVSKDRTLIDAMYVTIDNNLTQINSKNSLLLQPHVELKHSLFSGTEKRVCTLDWFPPDVDPAAHGLKIDPRKIPQRSPLWFKLRGEVSGSKAYTLIGYFVPGKHTKEGANYNYFKGGGTFTPFAKAAMRLGSISEDSCLIMYLCKYPHRIFYELGWCPAPSGSYPVGWGASPDGLIVDKNMTWDQVPEDIKKHYPTEAERAALNITQGAFEIKTSKTKLSMEPYFYPQVYMEMIVLNVVWCDLVRYRPESVYDAEKKEWIYEDVANVYRIFRHKPTEELLVKQWKYSHANASRIQDTVLENSFVELRAFFGQEAAEIQVHDKLTVSASARSRLSEYNALKAKLMEVVPFVEPHDNDEDNVLSDMNAIMTDLNDTDPKRQRRRFVTLLALQAEHSARLLQKYLE